MVQGFRKKKREDAMLHFPPAMWWYKLRLCVVTLNELFYPLEL